MCSATDGLLKLMRRMKTTRVRFVVCTFALVLAIPSFADDKGKWKPAKNPSDKGNSTTTNLQKVEPSKEAGKEPLIGVKVVITSEERQVIQDYVKSITTPTKPGKRAKKLPPGLAKKVARGGDLPPGWEKKCVPGAIMPPEVYKVCHPLPKDVVVKLPPPPPGTILVTVDGKVVRLVKATLEILDVFDVI